MLPNSHWHGWLVSVGVHTAIVAVALIAFDRTQMIEATVPFHIDVALVGEGASAPTAVETFVGGSASAHAPKQAHIGRSSSGQLSIGAQAITRGQTAVRIPAETVQPLQPMAIKLRPVNLEVQPSLVNKSADILMSESLNNVMSIPRQELSSIVSVQTERVIMPDSSAQSTAASEPHTVQGHAERGSEPVLTSTNPFLAREVGSDSSGTARHASPTETGENVLSTILEGSQSTQASITTASKEESRVPDRSAGSASASTKGSGPDYSWLKRLLWERIDRIKQYSDDALENEWEGRVIMVVTIRSDGRIDDVDVAESSGNRVLDREAAHLIAQVSPLELNRALDAAQVKLRVPISFGLK
ncbi:MAG: TonB family protein [Nitrospirota bacterium]